MKIACLSDNESNVLSRAKAAVNARLEKIGLKLPYNIVITDKESYSAEEGSKTIHINPEDAESENLAIKNLEYLILHELGHLFVMNHVSERLKYDEGVQDLFGDMSKFYRRALKSMEEGDKPDFISKYAQAHPEDNFCEVFAVLMYHDGDLETAKDYAERHHKNQHVIDQLIWMDRFIKVVAS